MERSIWSKLLDIFFPPFCPSCQNDIGSEEFFGMVCSECFLAIRQASEWRKKTRSLDRIIFYGSYADSRLQSLIRAFKYQGAQSLAKPLGELVARALEDAGVARLFYGTTPVVSFIPAHSLKERFRGYNHAALLALFLGEYFSLPVVPLARRTLLTPAQAIIDNPKDRRANIKNAFELLVSSVPPKIILVDDVYTSGSTMQEMARLLRKYGAQTIWGSTVAASKVRY